MSKNNYKETNHFKKVKNSAISRQSPLKFIKHSTLDDAFSSYILQLENLVFYGYSPHQLKHEKTVLKPRQKIFIFRTSYAKIAWRGSLCQHTHNTGHYI